MPKQSALAERNVFVDQYTARPVGEVPFNRFGVMTQATDLGIALHQGRRFGLLNQILMLIATLMLLLSSAAVVVMRRKRSPKGIGAPRKAPDRSSAPAPSRSPSASGSSSPCSASRSSRCSCSTA